MRDETDTPGDPVREPDPGLEAVYHRKLGLLVASLRRSFGAGPQDPEDVAQQAFQKILEWPDISAIRNLDASRWRTARNLGLQEKRSDRVRARYDFEVEQIFSL
ncbi:MAG: hypothetical protein AAGF44_13145 [Pseudomonadota bacterium]